MGLRCVFASSTDSFFTELSSADDQHQVYIVRTVVVSVATVRRERNRVIADPAAWQHVILLRLFGLPKNIPYTYMYIRFCALAFAWDASDRKFRKRSQVYPSMRPFACRIHQATDAMYCARACIYLSCSSSLSGLVLHGNKAILSAHCCV